MSHQTKYKSTLISMEFAKKAMERLGFKQIREHVGGGVLTLSFERKGCHNVHLQQDVEAANPITVSTDLHWGAKSDKIKRILGTPQNQYEALATAYNAVRMSEHFIAQGYEVNEQQVDGEVILTIGMQEAW